MSRSPAAWPVLQAPTGREPLDAAPVWEDLRAHRATRVGIRRDAEDRTGIGGNGQREATRRRCAVSRRRCRNQFEPSPLAFPLTETRRPFVYKEIADKAIVLSRLGMSACAIDRHLGVTDKTEAKALGDSKRDATKSH